MRTARQRHAGIRNSVNFGFPDASRPGGQKGCFPQQPQLHESNARKIRVRGGQPGIPFEQRPIGKDERGTSCARQAIPDRISAAPDFS